MPYLDAQAKAEIDSGRAPETAGELNYALTRVAARYLLREGVNYARLNETVGAMASATAELQRRIVAPYEDTKIAQNGDVYDDLREHCGLGDA